MMVTSIDAENASRKSSERVSIDLLAAGRVGPWTGWWPMRFFNMDVTDKLGRVSGREFCLAVPIQRIRSCAPCPGHQTVVFPSRIDNARRHLCWVHGAPSTADI